MPVKLLSLTLILYIHNKNYFKQDIILTYSLSDELSINNVGNTPHFHIIIIVRLIRMELSGDVENFDTEAVELS